MQNIQDIYIINKVPHLLDHQMCNWSSRSKGPFPAKVKTGLGVMFIILKNNFSHMVVDLSDF